MLYLYPPAFRRQFADEMADDFQEATEEAWANGFTGVLMLWTRVARDFLGSLAYQWLRSGVSSSALIPGVFSLLVAVLLHTAPRSKLEPGSRPRIFDPQINEMVLLIAVVVLIVAATVVITGRFWLSVFRRSRVTPLASSR
jgi:hypothetical protein